MKVESHRDLIVWQRAVDLAVLVYQLTLAFPREEMYGLSAQLRRAGVSVASNIAEGYGRRTTSDYLHFLGMARGSNLELQTQLTIAGRLSFGHTEQIGQAEALSAEVSKMLIAMMGKVSAHPHES